MGGRDPAVVGLAKAIGRVLFPHFCVRCGAEGDVLCGQCMMTVNASIRGIFDCPHCGRPEPVGGRCARAQCAAAPLDGMIAMSSYADPALRSLLHMYKFEGVEEAGARLEGLFRSFAYDVCEALTEIGEGAACIAVPLHPVRRAHRGFNQTDRFAAVVRDVTGFPDDASPLRRRLMWSSQSRIAVHAERRRNAAGSVRLGHEPGYPRYVLVDDVYTTGATMNECARVLKAAGAKEVWGVAVLRG